MQKSAKYALIACLVVVLGGGFAFYWFALRDTAPPEASLRTREDTTTTVPDEAAGSVTTAAAPDSADGEWVVLADDPEAVFVGYRVLELFGGETVKKEAAGRTPIVEGTMVVDGAEVTDVDITADLTGLESDSSRRDGMVQGTVLQTSEFPEATFVLTEPVDLGGEPSLDAPVTTTATGELTVHGVTKEVTFELEARWNGDTIDVAGSTPVVFADFGITAPETPAVSVDTEGTIELQLTFIRP